MDQVSFLAVLFSAIRFTKFWLSKRFAVLNLCLAFRGILRCQDRFLVGLDFVWPCLLVLSVIQCSSFESVVKSVAPSWLQTFSWLAFCCFQLVDESPAGQKKAFIEKAKPKEDAELSRMLKEAGYVAQKCNFCSLGCFATQNRRQVRGLPWHYEQAEVLFTKRQALKAHESAALADELKRDNRGKVSVAAFTLCAHVFNCCCEQGRDQSSLRETMRDLPRLVAAKGAGAAASPAFKAREVLLEQFQSKHDRNSATPRRDHKARQVRLPSLYLFGSESDSDSDCAGAGGGSRSHCHHGERAVDGHAQREHSQGVAHASLDHAQGFSSSTQGASSAWPLAFPVAVSSSSHAFSLNFATALSGGSSRSPFAHPFASAVHVAADQSVISCAQETLGISFTLSFAKPGPAPPHLWWARPAVVWKIHGVSL
jgi:hypothetical protein